MARIRVPLAVLEGWIKEGLLQGYSATELLRMFREQGGKIRTQTWYDIVREVRKTIDFRDTWNRWEWERPIGEAQHVPWFGNMRNRFQYKLEFELIDPETGELRRRYVTVGADVPLSPQEIYERVSQWLDPEKAEEDFTDPIQEEFISDVRIVEARALPKVRRERPSVEFEL